MPRLLKLMAGAAGLLAAFGLARGQDDPAAKPPTAAQLEKAVAEARRARTTSYWVETDPFTGKPIHSFRIREDAKDVPALPFAHELVVTADNAPRALDAFAATKPKPAVRLNHRLTAAEWAKLSGVESLTLAGRYDVREVAKLDTLTTLVGPYGEADLKELKTLKKLKNLTVEGVGDAGLKELGEFPALERLLVSHRLVTAEITADGVRALGGAKNLTQLGFAGVPSGFPIEAVNELTKLKGLTHLRLSKIGRTGPRAINSLVLLESAPALTTLELTEVDGAEFVRPNKFKALHTLRAEGDSVPGEFAANLKDAKGLKSLALTAPKLSDTDLEAIRGLRLEALYLTASVSFSSRGRRNFTGPGVARAVKDMKKLTVLSLKDVALLPPVPAKSAPGAFERPKDEPPKKDEAAKKDPPKPNIDAEATEKQNDEVIAALRGLTSLRSLDLRGTGIKEEDAEWLKEMKSLHYLYVDAKVGAGITTRLGKDLPNCTVVTSVDQSKQVGNEPAK